MMKRLKQTSVLIVLVVLIQGCASTGPLVYPDYSSGTTVHVSAETVSTMTETPAADHLLPDSQVFINGGSNKSAFFGLIGIAIDRSSSKSKVKGQDAVFVCQI